jgi:hypothetical protein
LVARLEIIPDDFVSVLEDYLDQPKSIDLEEQATLILKCASHFSSGFFIFDALDECEDPRVRFKLVSLLKALGTGSVRVMVTSRQPPPEGLDTDTLRIRAHDTDLEIYVRAELKNTKLKESLKDEIVAKIILSAQETYTNPYSDEKLTNQGSFWQLFSSNISVNSSLLRK